MSLDAITKVRSNSFGHIYVEQGAFQYLYTQRIIKRFPHAKIVKIGHYNEIFNRPRQNWILQKQARSLILGVRRKNFFYPVAPNVIQVNEKRSSYYSPIVQNCVYDCEYCFLQGMYPSANLLLFVNQEDFRSAALDLSSQEPISLSISYETDLMAIENLTGLCREWIEFSRDKPNLEIEIRTKSRAGDWLWEIDPSDSVLLSWTLSPQLVVESIEHGAASCEDRIAAVCKAIELGWRVRLCFDPILRIDGWQKTYCDLLDRVFARVSAKKIVDVTLGAFRINESYLKKMQLRRPNSKILFENYKRVNSENSSIKSYHNSEDLPKVLTEHLSLKGCQNILVC